MKDFRTKFSILSFVVAFIFSYNVHASDIVQISDVNTLKTALESNNCPKDSIIEITNSLDFSEISSSKKDISIKCKNVTIRGQEDRKVELKTAEGFRHFISDKNSDGLTIDNLVLSQNNDYSYGGGIHYQSESAALLIKNTTFKDIYGKYFGYGNNKNVKGSAIEADKAKIIIENSHFVGNTGDNSAGTIFNGSGDTRISNSFFENNKITTGPSPSVVRTKNIMVLNSKFLNNESLDKSGQGAIQTTTFEVDNSLFDGNISSNNAGAIYAGGAGTIKNSTFINNTAANSGGAIVAGTKPIVIENSTIANNKAEKSGAIEYKEGLKLVQSTIVSNLAAKGSGGVFGNNKDGSLEIKGSIIINNKVNNEEINLMETSENKWLNDSAFSNLVNLDKQDYKLDDLFDLVNGDVVLHENDGHTPTINLKNSSNNPALDKIVTNAPWLTQELLTDQAGIIRPQNNLIDIGAAELLADANPNEEAAKLIEDAITKLVSPKDLTKELIETTKIVIGNYDNASEQVKSYINESAKNKVELLRTKITELESITLPWDGKTSTEPKKENDVYLISSGSELKWFADETQQKEKNNYNARLINDIDLNNKNWTVNIGGSSTLNNYRGTFDGANHRIINFMSNGFVQTSLFNTSSGTIKNLSLSGTISSAYNDTGSVVSQNIGGTVSNVHSDVEIISSRWNGITNVGGVVGKNSKSGQILNSSFSGKIYGYTESGGMLRVGGIVGINESSSIIGCINKGELIGSKANTNIAYVGGIVSDVSYDYGNPTKNYIYNNINMGKVSAEHPKAKVGSIVGNITESSSAKGIENYIFNNLNNVIGAPTIHTQPTGNHSVNNIDNNYSVAYETEYKNGLVSIADMKKPEFVTRINSNDGKSYGITISPSVLYKEISNYYPTLTWDETEYDTSNDGNDTTQEDQAYIDAAIIALKDSSFELKPIYNKDHNANTMIKDKLKELGYTGIKVSVNKSSLEENIDKNGLIHYFYVDPSKSEDNESKSTISFSLNKKSITDSTDSIIATIPWDRNKLEQITKEQIANNINADSIKGDNIDLKNVTSDLNLIKIYNNKSWAIASWTSSNNSTIKVIAGASENDQFVGKVIRSSKDQAITLTLTLKNNRVSPEQQPLTITKNFNVIVKADNTSVVEQMQKSLDENYRLDKLTDFVTEKPIDPNNVSNDVRLLSTKQLGIEDYDDYNLYVTSDSDNLKIDSFKSSDGTINISYFRMYVYRPLEPDVAKEANFTVTMYNRAAKNISVSKDFKITIKPISNSEINQALKFMNDTKADYFNGINNGINKDKDNITQDLKNFHFALNDNGKVKWSYITPNNTSNKFNYEDSIRHVRNGVPKKGDEFFSSNDEIIEHDSMIVHRPKKDTKVTISSTLTSHIYAKYAEKYPNDERFAKMNNQKVSIEVTVLGSNNSIIEAKPASVFLKIEGENKTLMAKKKTNVIAKDISDIVSNSSSTWINTTNKKPVVTHALVQALIDEGHNPKDINILKTSNGTFVQSILGHTGDWMYLINNKMSNSSIHEQTLNEGDTVTFILLKDYSKQSLSYFDKDKIVVKDNQAFELKQEQLVVDQITWLTSIKPVAGAKLITEQLQNKTSYLVKHHDNVISNDKGIFKYSFDTPGYYYVTSHLGHDSLSSITRSTVTVVVKSTKLENLLKNSKTIKKGNYTTTSYNNLQANIKSAQLIYNKEKATFNEINLAITNLQKAKNSLKLETVVKKNNITYYYKYVAQKRFLTKTVSVSKNKTTTNNYIVINNSNKLSSSKVITKYKGKNIVTYNNIRTYHKNGRLATDKRSYKSASTNKNTKSTSTTYRSNGKKYRYTNYKFYKGYRKLRTEYIYNKNGQLKSTKKYGKSYRYVTSYNNKGKALKTVRKQYNSKGKLTKKTYKVKIRNSF